MIFLRSLQIAWRAILHNRSRAFLTMLGIIIGVAAVMMMLSIGTGAQILVVEEIQSLGSNLLVVLPGAISMSGIRTAAGNVTTLTLEDSQAISTLPEVSGAVPTFGRPAQVIAGSNNSNTQVIGTIPYYSVALNTLPSSGSFFSQEEMDNWERVAVLGQTVADNLFGDEDPLGKSIQIVSGSVRKSFRVIGVLAAKGVTGFFNRDDQLFVPITVAQKLLFGVRHVGSIFVEVSSPEKMDAVSTEIATLLRLRHNISKNSPNDFTIFSQQDLLGTLSTVFGYFTILLAGIAGISLLVGGIGIMNIMLVSVTERTREIGLRKALGALRRDIILQFLVEAVTLSTLGGGLGILLGYLGSIAIAEAVGWPAVITPTSVLLGFLFSMAVGLFFGIYPARRAANLHPIDALRYE